MDTTMFNRATRLFPHPYAGHPEWDRVLVLVISTPDGVKDTIANLHARQFAVAGAWSPPLPIPDSIEVMSVLSRRYRR